MHTVRKHAMSIPNVPTAEREKNIKLEDLC